MTVDDHGRVRLHRRVAILATAAGTVTYAALASLTRINTVPAVLAVAVPVGVVAAVALRRPNLPTVPDARLRRTTRLWAVVALTGLLWEAGAYFGELTIGQHEHPTVSVLLEPSLQDPAVRFVAWALWLLAAWRLVRR